MAITKIHAVKVRLGDAINYIENPDKTDGQELISGYNTAPQTAVLDFSVTAAMARKARNTSAKKQGNLAYHLIQSFSPDDAVTPERAHELGRKLAMEFTDGKFEFVVATPVPLFPAAPPPSRLGQAPLDRYPHHCCWNRYTNVQPPPRTHTRTPR